MSPEVFAALLRSAWAVGSQKQSMQTLRAIQASTVQKQRYVNGPCMQGIGTLFDSHVLQIFRARIRDRA
eukprot:1096953-Alexandrium_andersonii.AAC.1